MRFASVPQIIPITDLRYRPKDVIKMTADSPVIVTHRSRPLLVVANIDSYREMTERLQELEQLVKELQGELAQAK